MENSIEIIKTNKNIKEEIESRKENRIIIGNMMPTITHDDLYYRHVKVKIDSFFEIDGKLMCLLKKIHKDQTFKLMIPHNFVYSKESLYNICGQVRGKKLVLSSILMKEQYEMAQKETMLEYKK